MLQYTCYYHLRHCRGLPSLEEKKSNKPIYRVCLIVNSTYKGNIFSGGISLYRLFKTLKGFILPIFKPKTVESSPKMGYETLACQFLY